MNIENRIQAFAEEVQEEKESMLTKQEVQNLQKTSSEENPDVKLEIEEDDDSCDQSQLRHFIRACLYPYQNFSKKLVGAFGGPEALSDFNLFLELALGSIANNRFKDRMNAVYKIVAKKQQ